MQVLENPQLGNQKYILNINGVIETNATLNQKIDPSPALPSSFQGTIKITNSSMALLDFDEEQELYRL